MGQDRHGQEDPPSEGDGQVYREEAQQMSRSLKKGPFVDAKLMKRVVAMNSGGRKEVLRTWSRDSTTFPEMAGHTTAFHSGRRPAPIYLTATLVGPQLPDVALTT